MLYRDILRTMGIYLWLFLVPLALPTSIAIYTDWIADPALFPQPPSAAAFLITMGITAMIGTIFWIIGRKGAGHLYRREGLLLVVLVYLLTSLIGALPYCFAGTFSNPLDAFFESVSGITTTGATVMQPKIYDPATGKEVPYNVSFITGSETTYTFYGTIKPVINPKTKEVLLTGIEAVSPALLFWRSFSQCLGGGGIIVLFVAILPALGVGGKVLFQAEITGPSKESIFPKIKETASLLWKVFLGLIIMQTFLLMLTNSKFTLFDALTVSFATLSTGGFVCKNAGISYFASSTSNWIISLFMILGSVNFTLYFMFIRGKFGWLRDPELKVFLAILLISSLMCSWEIWNTPLAPITQSSLVKEHYTLRQAVEYGSFQAISAMTTTGFTTANYDLWPFSSQVLLLIIYFFGGMAGSTTGGVKVIRLQIFFRILMNKIESLFRPDTIREYRVGSSIIDPKAALTVLCFLMVVAAITILSTFLLVLDGVDPETSLTTVSSNMNTVGMAFRMGGPTQSFAFLSNFGKLLNSLLMIAGRLEYFALLAIFAPAFWKKA